MNITYKTYKLIVTLQRDELINLLLINMINLLYYNKIKTLLSLLFYIKVKKVHCVKSVRIRSYSGPHFLAFGLNTERYEASLRIQSECRKMRTRITPNTDTFRAVLGRLVSHIFIEGHHFVIVVNYAQSVLSRVVSGKYLALYVDQFL